MILFDMVIKLRVAKKKKKKSGKVKTFMENKTVPLALSEMASFFIKEHNLFASLLNSVNFFF